MKKTGALAIFIIGMAYFLLFMLFLNISYAECIEPESGMSIAEDALICDGMYDINEPIIIKDNVIVKCLPETYILGSNEGTGFLLEKKDNIEITNCKISKFFTGINITNSTRINMHNNVFDDNNDGVAVFHSNDSTVSNNEFTNNAKTGLYVFSSYNIKHNGNVYSGNNDNMIIEYECISWDGICPAACAADNDADCIVFAEEAGLDEAGDKNKVSADDEDEDKISDWDENGAAIEPLFNFDAEAGYEVIGDAEDGKGASMPDELPSAESLFQSEDISGQHIVSIPMNNNIPLNVFTETGITSEKHEEVSKYLDLSFTRAFTETITTYKIRITPKKPIYLLKFYEYFPKSVAEDAGFIVSSHSYNVVKKEPILEINLRNMKKDEPVIVTFSVNRKAEEEPYTIFTELCPRRDWFMGILLLSIIAFYAFYMLSIRKPLVTHSRYFHRNIMIKYLAITNDYLMAAMHYCALSAAILLIFEPYLKLAFGLWLLRIFISLVFLAYLSLLVCIMIDVCDFKKRYNVK